MAILRTALAAAVCTALAGCDLQRAPTPLEFTQEQVTVHSMLVAGADSAAVLLTRVLPGPQANPRSRPLEGAAVRIVAGRDTLHLLPQGHGADACNGGGHYGRIEHHLGPGCYMAAVPGGVGAGESYELIVDLPGGGRIHGTATVPDVPVLMSPDAGTEFETRDVPSSDIPPAVLTRWAPVGPEMRLELRLDLDHPDCTVDLDFEEGGVQFGLWPWPYEVTGRDSVSLRIVLLSCYEPVDITRLDGRLVLTAFDSAYSRYVQKAMNRSTRVDAASVGITGALGVFAGAASADVPVVIILP